MKQQLHYNFTDVLWSPARAFSAKKILVMTFYLLVALLLFDIFTYIALAVDGEKVGTVFDAFDFFPFYNYVYTNIIAQIIFIIGFVGSILSLMLGFFSVSLLEIEELKGDRFFNPFKTLKISLSRIKQIVLAELGIISFVLFVILLYFIFGLLCRIPIIGDWLFAIAFIIPNFLFSIITVFVILILVISVILLPAVAAVQEKDDSFQAILETFSTIIRQPFRWLGYTIYGIIAGKFFSYVYAYFCYRAIQFTVMTSSIGGGKNIKVLAKSAVSLLPYNSDVAEFALHAFPGFGWGFSLSKFAVFGSFAPASYLLAFMMFIIFTTVLGYFLSVIATAQTRGYVLIRYFKDGYRIPEEN
jgi:hypothetical protein